MKKTKVPMVLSGGGARGFAHLGVLKALEEASIYPSAIAATSAGALVGAFLADGYSSDEIKALILKHVKLSFLFDFRLFKPNVITLNKMGEFMRKHLRHTRIEDLPIPFYPTATNFLEGSQHIFKSGDVVEAALAASSIPAIFPPRMIDQVPYVDGGLVNNLPIEPFEHKKKEVITVHVNPIASFDPKSSLAHTIDRSLHLSFLKRVTESSEGCLLHIEPGGLHQFGLFDIHKFPEIYEIGYAYTVELLKGSGLR